MIATEQGRARSRTAAGSALLWSLWALTLVLGGLASLLFVVGFVVLPVGVAVLIVATCKTAGCAASAVRAARAGATRATGAVAFPLAAAAADAYTAQRLVEFVASW